MKASEWKERTLLGLWWLMFGAAATWLLVGSTAYWVKHGWLPPDTSGWVQAFGGLGAVVAALWVSSAQARAARVERQRREYHYMSKAFNVASFGNACMQIMAGAANAAPSDTAILRMYLGQLEQSIADFAQFSYAEFVDLKFADSWQMQLRSLKFFARELEQHLSGEEKNIVEGASAMADAHKQLFAEMEGLLNAYSVRVGAKVWSEHHP
ncbi:hypothetical protein [Metapseudomonas otitidis]|uniref:hypothetical protein n=1 Tax=Metapseudomonas otitidis TaxID=319939 RepID=UPI00261EA29D|nr:hypothetical protein [Pseudomonas otitidis]